MKKILIIDDDKVFIKVLGDALVNAGFSVLTAFNGQDGLSVFAKGRPDLVILDMKMPGLDGIGFLKKLREQNDDKTPVPVVIVSNLSDIDKVSESVSLGIKGYISKTEETTENIVEDVKRVIDEEEKRRQQSEAKK